MPLSRTLYPLLITSSDMTEKIVDLCCCFLQGITHGSKFKSKVLKMSWHIPKPDISSSISHVSTDSDLDTEVRGSAS